MQTVKPRMDCARYASWCQNRHSALLLYAARAGGWLGQRLCKSLCFYAARADLAKQRRQLAEMPQWQLRDIGIDPIAAKAEAEKSSWGAEPPWQKPQWANAAVEKAAGAEAEAGQTGLAIIRAALKSSFAENTLITSIMPR